MPTTEDRLTMLRNQQASFTGIEFVQVVDACDQTQLRVYFLTDVQALLSPIDSGPDALSLEALRIYSPRGEAADVEIESMTWDADAELGRDVLQLTVAQPGSFTDYRLLVDDPRVDRVFNDVAFSFKVGCESRFDCADTSAECSPRELDDFAVDYLARDFVSLRNALMDFAEQRYPGWSLPREADVGVMFAEVLSALGDEFSYIQDRVNREAYLETATQRRSLRRKARLVDHEIHDGRMASTIVELSVLPATTSVPAKAPIWVRRAGEDPIRFELGLGLLDPITSFEVNQLWNPGRFTPYGFDDESACLRVGDTELWVRNDPANPDNPGGVVFTPATVLLWQDRWLLLRDRSRDPSDAERAVLVRVTQVQLELDPLFGIALARIKWRKQDALTFPIALDELELSGNLVPATAGESRRVWFRLGQLLPEDIQANENPSTLVLPSVMREGPLFTEHDPSLLGRVDPCADDESTESRRPGIQLLSLPGTEDDGLAFSDPHENLRDTLPELRVTEVADVADVGGLEWTFRRRLLDQSSDDDVYTIEDGSWRRIVAYATGAQPHIHRDYATGAGYTVRFGDGEFGKLPPNDGLMKVEYRLGSGTRANVPRGSVSALTLPNEVGPLSTLVEWASNPFAVVDGVDPESESDVKKQAPHAYAAETLFAVRPEDYGRQAETLEFVQRAQGAFRWTGSWLSALTAVDPRASYELSSVQREQLERLLGCRRQSGREVIVCDPRYVNLDLEISICVARHAYAAHVRPKVLEALIGRRGSRPTRGLLAPDNFTFGTPLRRSAVEAALQRVDGVESVLGMRIRNHGVTAYEPFSSLSFDVADDEVIRLDNDALRPERGSLSLLFEGGA